MAERVLVVCPRCREQAEVLRTGPRFACGKCGLARSGMDGGYFGMATATVRRKCRGCGRVLQRSERRRGPHPSKVGVRCPGCSRTTYIPVAWQADPGGEAYDPQFGFALWLQTRCAGDVLWAYNAEHLSFLLDFVGASIRRRTPNANGTLASRLPAWMKKAGSRDAVLRGLARLERRLVA